MTYQAYIPDMRLFDEVDRGDYSNSFIIYNPKRAPKRIHKTINQERQDESICDGCPICYEDHKMVESVLTPCGHYFGLQCINESIKKNLSKKEEVLCPLCRSHLHKLVVYRPRVNRQNTQR